MCRKSKAASGKKDKDGDDGGSGKKRNGLQAWRDMMKGDMGRSQVRSCVCMCVCVCLGVVVGWGVGVWCACGWTYSAMLCQSLGHNSKHSPCL